MQDQTEPLAVAVRWLFTHRNQRPRHVWERDETSCNRADSTGGHAVWTHYGERKGSMMVGARQGALDADSLRRFKIGFVLLVGLSGTMMGLQGGGSPAVIALTTVTGLLAGWALLWYLTWVAR